MDGWARDIACEDVQSRVQHLSELFKRPAESGPRLSMYGYDSTQQPYCKRRLFTLTLYTLSLLRGFDVSNAWTAQYNIVVFSHEVCSGLRVPLLS